MTELRQQWFKIWASEALLSDDLDELTDHEERVWWRVVMVASLEEPRWFFIPTAKTAQKCHTTERKMQLATAKFVRLGMLSCVQDGIYFVANGPKWNENTERRRKPSDSPEAIRERVARHRNALRNAEGNALLKNSNAAHKEEEEEEEEEKEKSVSALKRGATRLVPLTEEERRKLLVEFPNGEETIALALSHKSHRNYPDNQYGYVRNWLRRDAQERRPLNGRNGIQQQPDEEDPIVRRLRLDAERERQLGLS